MALPPASHVKRFFIDEPQHCFSGHPDRALAWRDFALRTSTMNIQRNYCSATLPPHLLEVFCSKATLDTSVDIIRGSTN